MSYRQYGHNGIRQPNTGRDTQGQQQGMIHNWETNEHTVPPYHVDQTFQNGPPMHYNAPPMIPHEYSAYMNHPLVPTTSKSVINRIPGRLNISICSNCKNVNYLVQSELDSLDNKIVTLEKKVVNLETEKVILLNEKEILTLRVQELEGKLARKEQTVQKEGLINVDNNAINSVQKCSKLSPTATEFNPNNPKKIDVPVVSAKGIKEEDNVSVSHDKGARKQDSVPVTSPKEAHKEVLNTSVDETCGEEDYKKTGADMYSKTRSNPKNKKDDSTYEISGTRNKRRVSEHGEKVQGQDWRENNLKTSDQQERHSHTTHSSDRLYHKRSNDNENRCSTSDYQREGHVRETPNAKQLKHNHPENRRTNRTSGTSSSTVDDTGASGGTSKSEREKNHYGPNKGSRKQNSDSFNNENNYRSGQTESRGRNTNYSSQSQDNSKKSFKQYDNVKDGNQMDRANKVKLKDIVKEIKGDLFSAPPEYSLAHCVAEDFRMGSGIAVMFKQEFKRTGDLLAQNVKVGGCAHLEDRNHKRFIFYLVTKGVSSGKPTYESLGLSLIALRDKCKTLNVTKLAIPHIGCGLDRLDWDKVKEYINDVFSETDIEIVAYDFNADGLPEAEGNRTKGPFGVRVVYKVMQLKDIDIETTLLFFGTEDGHMDSTATSLNEKLHFLQTYKTAPKTVGSICCCKKSDDYYVYSLIVQKKFAKNEINFSTLDSCCRELNKLVKKEQLKFLGMEYLADWSDDPLLSEKVATLLRHSLPKPAQELWLCYRDEKQDMYKMCERYASRQTF